jgi:hypothetical protein
VLNKLGIITFHNVINHGAVLQAYALVTYLNKEGYNCEVIDYKCKRFEDAYKTFKIYNQSLQGIVSATLKIPINYRKKKCFQKFQKDNMILSKTTYSRNTIADSNKVYDRFITGSDQIWNLALTGMDETYLLDFVNSHNEKISYAASLGKVTLSEDERELFKKWLNMFNAISVREEDAKIFLEGLIGRKVNRVLDPVFLLNDDEWSKLLVPTKHDKYILVYILHEKTVYTLAERIAKLTGYRIISLQNNLLRPINAEYRLTDGPIEFLSLIRGAEYIVTDSFHGAAFSVIFRKKLKIVLKKQHKNLNERLETLVNEIGIRESIVDDTSSDEVLLLDFKYELIKANIDQAINHSKNYLLRELGDNDNDKKRLYI